MAAVARTSGDQAVRAAARRGWRRCATAGHSTLRSAALGHGSSLVASSICWGDDAPRTPGSGLNPGVAMTATIPSIDIVVSVEPLFTQAERIALAGFLAGYTGLTRDAYALDLRMFTAWCQQHGCTCSRHAARMLRSRHGIAGAGPRDHRAPTVHD